MKSIITLVTHFFIAVFCTFLLASLFHTQFVLHELVSLGIAIEFDTRVSTSLDDFVGLIPLYGSIVTIALLFGFGSTKLLFKFSKKPILWLYPVAGFIALITVLVAMQPIMDITFLAGARSLFGKICQGLAGMFGGFVFMQLRHKYHSSISQDL
jgi:hypothetical protein